MSVSTLVMNVEKGVEVAADDVLKFLTKAEKVTATAGPQVVAGLGTLLGAVGTAIASGEAAAAAGGSVFRSMRRPWWLSRACGLTLRLLPSRIGIKI